jgi:hypothetical protein
MALPCARLTAILPGFQDYPGAIRCQCEGAERRVGNLLTGAGFVKAAGERPRCIAQRPVAVLHLDPAIRRPQKSRTRVRVSLQGTIDPMCQLRTSTAVQYAVGRNRFIAPFALAEFAARVELPASLAETGRLPRRGETTRRANHVRAAQSSDCALRTELSRCQYRWLIGSSSAGKSVITR